ncbi:MAG TPA: hypothetical protein VK049_08500 [Paenalcaligenes sp.]|nr:hypothetical protein [Paenalcaligenes sp.]
MKKNHIVMILIGLCLIIGQAVSASSHHIRANSISIEQQAKPVWVELRLPSQGSSQSSNLKLQHLLLTLHWQHPAQLSATLCDARRKQCRQASPDGHLAGSFFTDQSIYDPLWLKLEVKSWQGGYPPAHVRVELALWSQP